MRLIATTFLIFILASATGFSQSLSWVEEGNPVKEFIIYFDCPEPYTYEVYVMDFEGELRALENGTGKSQYEYSLDLSTSGTGIVVLLHRKEGTKSRALITVSRLREDDMTQIVAVSAIDEGPKVELFVIHDNSPWNTREQLDEIMRM